MKSITLRYIATETIEVPDEFEKLVTTVDKIAKSKGMEDVEDYLDEHSEETDALIDFLREGWDAFEEIEVLTEDGIELINEF